MAALLTVAETPEYVRRAERLLSGAERADVVERLAADPTASGAERMELAALARLLKTGA